MLNLCSKKIKGSAWTDADGSFIFTPYAKTPVTGKNLVRICSGQYASLWVGRKSASVRIVFDRNEIPPYEVYVEESAKMYNALVKHLKEKANEL